MNCVVWNKTAKDFQEYWIGSLVKVPFKFFKNIPSPLEQRYLGYPSQIPLKIQFEPGEGYLLAFSPRS